MVAAGLAAGAGLAASLGAGAIECRAARWFSFGLILQTQHTCGMIFIYEYEQYE